MKYAFYQLKKYPLAFIAIIIILFWIISALIGPSLLEFTYTQMDSEYQMVGPGQNSHILGTDALGRDILSRIVVGSRSILTVALFTSIFFNNYWCYFRFLCRILQWYSRYDIFKNDGYPHGDSSFGTFHGCSRDSW